MDRVLTGIGEENSFRLRTLAPVVSDGPALRNRRASRTPPRLPAVLGLLLALTTGFPAEAGDILRGGASANTAHGSTPFGTNPPATTQARANSKDALARTTQAVQAVQAMQAAARQAAVVGPNNLGFNPNKPGQPLPSVPNGLGPGGLQVAPSVPKNLAKPVAGENVQLWQGAELPRQSVQNGQTNVVIAQRKQQAILTWQTFNIGKNTTLTFDQSAGGANRSQWIAFNKITDPSGAPSQILGSIKADGQVYVINQNGIIFGGSSQVNAHTLVASSLPINDTLITRGLLNQEAGKVRFLFTATAGDPAFQLAVGTTTYTLTQAVAPGSVPSIIFSSGGNKTTLVSGTDYTLSKNPAGRTVASFTAAGLVKVGQNPITVAYTSASGAVTVQAGATLTSPTTPAHVGGRIALVGSNVTNAGTISTADGQTILAAGREVGFTEHPNADPSLRGLDVYVGAVDAFSGIATNEGLIDAPRANTTMAGKVVNQLGVIDSSTSVSLNGRIDLLANYNAVGNTSFDPTKAGIDAFLFQSAGTVNLGAGSIARILPELSSDETAVGSELALRSLVKIQGQTIHFGTRSLLLAPNADATIAAGSWNYLPPLSNFVNAKGQIYFDFGAGIDVAGTPDVALPITQNFLNLQLRGAELADSPLQRAGLLRGVDITVDIRKQGTFNGFAWVGTPLGDVTGFIGLIQHKVGELTTAGGNVKLSAGESVIMQPGSLVDVSGGWISYEGGIVKTTRLVAAGQLLDISQATPDRVYDGIYTGTFTQNHPKYGLSETYSHPLALTGSHFEAGYLQGADGGTIAITAPSMALDGQLLGQVTAGPRQRQTPAAASELALSFLRQPTGAGIPPVSPAPPRITFQNLALNPADPFAVDVRGTALPLREDRRKNVALSPELFTTAGFGKLTIDNVEGEIVFPTNLDITTPVGGAITLSAANITIQGRVKAPSGTLSFTAYNYSPLIEADTGISTPYLPNLDRGSIRLSATAELSTAGLIVDDSRVTPRQSPWSPDGGAISLVSYSAYLQQGSVLDVSGGITINAAGQRSFGSGGSINIAAGQDPGKNRDSVLGGDFILGATLHGYSGSKGGSLALRAPLIQIGGNTLRTDTLVFAPSFFSQGGFTSFSLTGLGATTPRVNEFIPGILIAPGTLLAPVAESWLASPYEAGSDRVALTPIEKPAGLRTPVSLTFNAPGVTRPDGTLLIRGSVVLGAGAQIITDPKASVSISAQTAAILGSIIAPSGSISIAGANKYPLLPGTIATQALPTVYLGPSSFLSTAGTTLLIPDAFGRRLGSVLGGGTIAVSGNIVAESGAVLDVSGTSAMLDLAPAYTDGTGALNGLVNGVSLVPARSGITAPLWSTAVVPTRLDSDGGTITLKGGEELFVDATLLGRAGGPTALGGNLVVSSGRFYGPNDLPPTPADFTLQITQSGPTRPQIVFTQNATALGTAVLSTTGQPALALGHFSADTFTVGGFDSLSLLGNVQFLGPVTINARRELTIASGGVLSADSAVQLTAAHAVLGTAFLPPASPGQQPAPFLLNNLPFFIPPSFGPGSLTVSADLIEIGNLSLKNIGRTQLIADGGEIRGDGTLDVVGQLYLRAGQIYPASATQFKIVAYDYTLNGKAHSGSITIRASGQRDLPYSAGGQLAIFASQIDQGGVLRAPSGTIQIGWEDAASAPQDLISGVKIPIAQQVTLQPGSITSVSLVDPATGQASLLPYGLSTDGSNWIDPTGTDIAGGKLPNKQIGIAGVKLEVKTGATIDLSGGGDLYAYRFLKGNGGSTDLLEWNFQGGWTAGKVYTETQIVSYKGAFYYARTDLTDDVAATPPTPGPFWKQVSQSFAVIPDYEAHFAPYGAFSGSTDPGYVQAGLAVGDRIHLDTSNALPAGTYTLLPARYALLPGAVLVTPQSGVPIGTFANPDGGSFASGYRFNDLNAERQLAPTYSRFEVASQEVIRSRALYADYFANSFLAERAKTLEVKIPRLPADAGYLRLLARTALVLEGNVLAKGLPFYHGGAIDIASTAAAITILGADRTAGPNQIFLNAARLNQFGAESLLIGGYRDFGANGAKVTVTTDHVTINNAGTPLTAPEIILTANQSLTIAANAAIIQTGTIPGAADTLFLGDATKPGSGNGLLLRVSSDPNAQVLRTGVDTTDLTPTLTVQGGVLLSGQSLILDSTANTSIDPNARLDADTIALNSGQIVLQLNPNATVPPASGLVIKGALLDALKHTQTLSLLTYRSLDIYGSGTFAGVGNLTLHAAEIRGFDNAGGTVQIKAGSITLDNRAGTLGPGPDPALGGALAGTLEFDAARFRLGKGDLQISQFQLVDVRAPAGLLVTGTGSLKTGGDFHATTAFVTASGGIKNSIIAGGDLTFDAVPGVKASTGSGLGATLTLQGSSVTANSDFILHSGSLTLQATGLTATDGITVGGRLDVSGTSQTFYDLIRYTGGGNLALNAKSGNITIDASAALDVSAQSEGGDAGSVSISVPNGDFVLAGKLNGKAGAGGKAGSFALDVRALPTTAAVATTLDAGGFTEAQSFRIRTGDVTIDSISRVHAYDLSTDQGSIIVAPTGEIDAHGATGGSIRLIASESVELQNGSILTVEGDNFSHAGKGGSVSLEAGASVLNGGSYLHSSTATVDIQQGSTISLGVKSTFDSAGVPDATLLAASAALGRFTGTLHLRAPQIAGNQDLQISTINGDILGASSVTAEGYRVYQLSGSGTITSAIQGQIFANGATFGGNSDAISTRLIASNNTIDPALFSVQTGAEVVNLTGNLTLGTSVSTATSDWNLSTFRFGTKKAPGVLTLRAAGDLVFFNSLSDGFNNGSFTANLLDLNAALPANAQSWSYRLTSGADLSAVDIHRVQTLDDLAPDVGSLKLGKNLAPTGSTTASAAARIFQVIRTGSGDIDISAGRDVVMQNLFANIYTAGTLAPDQTLGGTFALPRTGIASTNAYLPQYSFAGGNVIIVAQNDIRRDAKLPSGLLGSQEQLPINWLYRRGAIDAQGVFEPSPSGASAATFGEIASTSWWVDFSNFFEGVGALGGGNVTLFAGHDISNLDAVIPTNARMPGRDTVTGQPLAPDAGKLLELGGGDLTVRAGNDLDAGVYYVERGLGSLQAGHEIKTNASRYAASTNADIAGEPNWLPTTLFVGKASFDIRANGNILLGPVANSFLLPLGANNSFSYKTYFSTYAPDSALSITSLGGSVTLRESTALPTVDDVSNTPVPILQAWLKLLIDQSQGNGAGLQKWLSLAERDDVEPFTTATSLLPGTLRVTAFSGDINLAGTINLSPSPVGDLALLAGGQISGLRPVGTTSINGNSATIWSSSKINLSDADPAALPEIATPKAFQNYLALHPELPASSNTAPDFLLSLDQMFDESGSTQGISVQVQQSLHGSSLLHSADLEPLRLYARSGDIGDFTLFSAKPGRIFAGRDVNDVSFYLQNLRGDDVSVISSGRDIFAYNANSPRRTDATGPGNYLAGTNLVDNIIPDSEAGDLQISGPGALQVLAGRNLDLGAGANRIDGTGVGLVSVGNLRNPNLPDIGANIIAGAGLPGPASLGDSTLNFVALIKKFATPENLDLYLPEIDPTGELSSNDFKQLSVEAQNALALDVFYLILRDSGRAHAEPTSPAGNYEDGNAAIEALFGKGKFVGNITTQARDIRTRSGGNISLLAPGGKLTLATSTIGNSLIPPGVVTEDGGAISIFTDGSVDIGISRIFTLHGGDIVIWSANGDIAAGSSAKTVKSAPPTRVVIDQQSADVQTDLAGLATGGGIGVLATVADVEPGDVDLIAPTGVVDAGDAGIRASGNLNIAATAVLNADNIQVAGASTGVPAAPTVAAPNLGGLTAGNNATAATNNAANEVGKNKPQDDAQEDLPSIITVDLIDFTGGEDEASGGGSL